MVHSRKGNIAVAMITLLILVLGSLIVYVPGSEGTEGPAENAAPTRDSPTSLHRTATLLKEINDVSIRTQIGANKRLIENNGTLFYTWSWFNNSVITVSVIASYDKGANWTSKVDVWADSFFEDAINKELYIWKGDLYLFWQAHHSYRNYRQIYMKKTPLSNWQNLKTATKVAIRSTEGHSFQIDSDDNYIYMSMVRASQWMVYFYRYNGVSWTSGTNLCNPGAGTQCDIMVVKDGSSTKLLFFYHRPYLSGWSTGYVYLRTSTNYGSSWTSGSIVMNSHNNYEQIDSLNINGTLLFFASLKGGSQDDIEMIVSRNAGSTWSQEKKLITNRGISQAHSGSNYGFSLGTRAQGKIVQLMYEGYPEQVRMIYSEDWGSNWIPESQAVVLHSSNSFDPLFGSNPKYLSYAIKNGSRYDVEIVDITNLFVDDYSPMNLSVQPGFFSINLSWEPPHSKVFDFYNFIDYKLFRGTSPTSLSLYKTLGNVTSYNDTIPSYTPTRYYYKISATFSKIGASPFTNVVSEMHLIPPPPKGLWKTEGDLSVSISWDPLFSEVLAILPLEYYTIYRGNYPDSLFPVARVYDSITYNDPDIDMFPSNYHYRISYSLSGIGEGPLSDMITAKPNTLPKPPRDLDFDDIVNGVKLSWKEPLDSGKLPITEYVVFKGVHEEELEEIARLSSSTLSLDQTDLVAGDDFFYTVSAINRLGSSIETEPLLVSYRGISSIPEDLLAVGKNMSIHLTWNDPKVTWGLPISWYYIYKGTSPSSTSLYKTVAGSETLFSDIVDVGITYYYEVSAVNNFGESQKIGPVSAIATGPPGKVTSISIGIGDGMISLDWEPVADDGGTPIIHYSIYSSLDNSTPHFVTNVPTGLLSYEEVGLINGQEYFFWITASNLNGEGVKSTPVVGTPGKDPFAVSDISIYPRLYGAILEWEYPLNGGREISDFRIYRGEGPHSLHYLTDISTEGLEDPAYNDEGLSYSITYYYCVTAVNSMGESGFSPIVSTTPFGAPEDPTIIMAEGDLDEMTIAWIPPTDDGGLPLEIYKLYYKEDGSNQWEFIEIDPTILYSLITQLEPGTVIEVMVTASNQLAESSGSNIVRVTIGSTPTAIETISIDPRDSGCTISWEQPKDNGYAIESYSIYLVDKGGFLVWIGRVDRSILTYDVDELLNDVEYTFRLSAENILGEGPLSRSESVIPATVPGTIETVSIEETGDGFVKITWAPPEQDGGRELLEYRVYRGISIGSEVVINTISSDVLEFTDESALNGEEYYYRVTAVNILGEGEMSSHVQGRPLGLPSIPVKFKASTTTDTVTLSWEAPVNPGGETIHGYVLYKGSSENDLEVWRYLGPQEDSAIDEDVMKGTYLYRIMAYNSRGMGESSSQKVEVPSRIPIAASISIFLFLIPLLIILCIILIPMFIRKTKEKKAKEEEEKKKLEAERAKLISPPTGHPGLTASLGMRTLPTGTPPSAPPRIEQPVVRPPERRLPPAQGQRVGEGYARPPAPKPAPAPVQQPPSPSAQPAQVVPPTPSEPAPKTSTPPVINELNEQVIEPPEPPKDEKVLHEDKGAIWSPQMVETRTTTEAKSAIQMLQDLNDLKEKGAITQEEYETTKKHLLRKI